MNNNARFFILLAGEVSDSDVNSDGDAQFEFNDGLDDELMGDEKDRERLSKMTEKEREQEIFNRLERREMLKTRCDDLFFISNFKRRTLIHLLCG